MSRLPGRGSGWKQAGGRLRADQRTAAGGQGRPPEGVEQHIRKLIGQEPLRGWPATLTPPAAEGGDGRLAYAGPPHLFNPSQIRLRAAGGSGVRSAVKVSRDPEALQRSRLVGGVSHADASARFHIHCDNPGSVAQDNAALDKLLADGLKEMHNKAADLYNAGDTNEEHTCFRVG